MNTQTNEQRIEALERMVDELELPVVLDLLAEVCARKAEHVLANWQDKPLADYWQRFAKVLSNLTMRQAARGRF